MSASEHPVELVVYRGLPASGKTTSARAWVTADPEHRARVNRDDLRAMLHHGFVSNDVEHAVVSRARDALIGSLLRAGISVACDDTNLPQRRARDIAAIGWRAGVHVRVVDLTDVPVELCVERDYARGQEGGRAVGSEVIMGMYERFLSGGRTLAPVEPHETGPAPEDGYLYEPDESLTPVWLVDLDGTLALMNGRGPYDWHRVGEDEPNLPVLDIVRRLDIVVVSGRDAVCRAQTEEWLERHRIYYHDLLMRPEGDQRRDAVVKLELFRERIAPRYNVLGSIDDRRQVVEMWRRIGLFCAQVAPGEF